MKNKISAICCTYRRPEFLEEAIQSFLMQDFAGEKELIILNDEPEQELIFHHAQIKIYNLKERAVNLAMKHNHAVSLATGNIIMPWDDDDIYLPHRLTAIEAQQKNGLWYTDYLFIDRADSAQLDLAHGVMHCNTAYTKDAFIQCGAYHDQPNMPFDCALINGIRDIVKNIGPDNIAPSYIYRKNTNTNNLSKQFKKDFQTAYEEYPKNQPEFQKGKITLNPHWSADWTEKTNQALQHPPTPLHQLDKTCPPPEIITPLHEADKN